MPVVFAQHASWSDFVQIVAERIVLRSGNGMFHAVRFDSILAESEAKVGSKTCNGLTYLELGLVNIVGLLQVSEVISVVSVEGLTKPLTSILPVVSGMAADGAALACLAGFVDLPTPPTGPEGAGRAASERRPPRPRLLVWRLVLRMSSRLVSSLEDMLMVV
jgi:hypothetical protein